jgi:hypothetical protein
MLITLDYLAIVLIHVHHASHSLCIHDIHIVHMHAIGVPKGVTLVEFERMCQKQREASSSIGGLATRSRGTEEGVLECPSHGPSSFMKGKPWSIISLLL